MVSQTEYGQEFNYVFTPNSATEVTSTGIIILDPLDFGADDGDYGEYMTSDFAWPIVGVPTYSATPPVAGAELAAADA
jgi:hypothetical protein